MKKYRETHIEPSCLEDSLGTEAATQGYLTIYLHNESDCMSIFRNLKKDSASAITST